MWGGMLSQVAALALVLAVLGVYGVVSYSVSQRTHEIGIRMAVGAGRGRVIGMVLGDGLRLALAAAALGLVAAAVLTRSMSQLLYGVGPLDPLTLAGCAATLVLVALAGERRTGLARHAHRPGSRSAGGVAGRPSTLLWTFDRSTPSRSYRMSIAGGSRWADAGRRCSKGRSKVREDYTATGAPSPCAVPPLEVQARTGVAAHQRSTSAVQLRTTVSGCSLATTSGTTARNRFPSAATSKLLQAWPFSAKSVTGVPSSRAPVVRTGTATSSRSAET